MLRPSAVRVILLAAALTGTPARAAGDGTSVASKLPGWWSYRGTYGPSVQGTLTIDGRDAHWRASIAGFEVAAIREGDALRFALPGAQGEFRGTVRGDRRAIDGFWIQPPGVTLGSAYATPVMLRAVSRDAWVGTVRPLADRITLFLNITPNGSGGLSGLIRNPEFNFGLRRPLTLSVRDNEVSFINSKRDNDVLRGEFDSDSGQLSMIYQGVGVFGFTRADSDSLPGAKPRPTAAQPALRRAPIDTGDGWTTATPAAAGLSAAALERLTEHVRAQVPESVTTPYLHAILIARHGKLVYEEYFHGFDREQPHDTRSAGKTLTSILLGIAMERAGGFGVDTPVRELFPQYSDLRNDDPRKAAITVGQLLTMTSGLDCDDNDSASAGNEDVMQSQREERDWYRYTLDLKVARDPGGKQAVYCSAGINLLGGIIARRSGLALPEFFERHLARPLQFGDYHMNLMPNGAGYGAGGIYLRPRDALKLGQLYLSRGRWNGRRLVSPAWVDASTRRHAQFDDGHGYGYGWHLHEVTAGARRYREYAAEGNGGQFVIVLPELDLTVMIAAGNYGDFSTWYRFLDLVPEFILPAVVPR